MKNLVWTNANPDGTPCPVCRELIGCVFDPDSAPPCPVHPSCYCLLVPTDQEVNTTADATGFSESSQETWAKYKSYLLLKGFNVPSFLRPLDARQAANAQPRLAEDATRDQCGVLMRLEDITPDSLAGLDQDELLSLHHRLHQLWGLHFEETPVESVGGLKREDAWNTHNLIVREMRDRGIDHAIHSLIDTHLAAMAPVAPSLPCLITVVPQFVSIVGSVARHGLGHDLDILVRTDREDNRMTIWADNIDLPLRNILDPGKAGYLHFIANPQGPHAEALALYDLALVRRKNLAESLKPGDHYQVMKPAMSALTDAYSVDELWPWVEKWLERGQHIFASPKIDGFRAIISQRSGNLSVRFEESQPAAIEGLPEDLPVSGDFIVEGEYTARKDDHWLTRPELMAALTDPDAQPHFWLYDLLCFDGKDISQVPFTERLEKLKELPLPGANFTVLEQNEIHSRDNLEEQLKRAQGHTLSEGLFLRTDAPYHFGSTDTAAKLKFVLELKVLVLEAIHRETGWTYRSGLTADGAEFENTLEHAGNRYVDLGNTFVSKQKLAEEGQILNVLIEELGIARDGEKQTLYWGKPNPQGPDTDRDQPYTALQAIDMAKRRGVFKEEQKDAAVAHNAAIADDRDETRGERADRFWQEHWTEALPPSGKGDFTYQHHWRGLDEEETSLGEEDLLKTTHSVHGDLRCSFGKALWGFTCYLGTTEDLRNARDLPQLHPDDALQGSFKLFQPTEWLTIAREGPFLSEPADIGATPNKYAKFFEVAHGAWEVGVWREHSIEIFLTSPTMSGRYLISYTPVGEGERIWTIRKPEDQTPIFDKEDKEKLIAELKGKAQRYLVWSKPGRKPELIDIGEEP